MFSSRVLAHRLIQFGKVDLGYSYPDLGSAGCLASSDRKRNYPTLWISNLPKALALPNQGTGKVKFKVVRREATTDEDGTERHGASIQIESIDPDEPAKSKEKPARILPTPKLFSSRVPIEIQFEDPRPRDSMGQYSPQEAGAPDPNAMAAAYGGVVQEKQARQGALLRAWRNRQIVQPDSAPQGAE